MNSGEAPMGAGSATALDDLAYRDELTGLYNRRYLRKSLDRVCAAAREQRSFLSVLFIDVDYFKSINDRYGHDQGDKVLTVVARAIQELTPPGGIAIRFAGDEFMVLLPGGDRERAVDAGQLILEGVRTQDIPLSTGDVLRQTLSIGAATYPLDTEEPEHLKELADEAVFISKKKGRNCVSTLDEKPPESLEPQRLFKYFPCRKFVGRADLLGTLRRFLSPAPGLVRPFVLLQGPRGIGRSRVLDELVNLVDVQRTHLLRARSRPVQSGQPFGELAEAVERLFESDPERIGALANVDQGRLAGLSPLIPSLVRFGLVSPSNVPSLTSPVMVQAMGELLAALAFERPLIVVLDDFQWCNQGTRLALEAARLAGAKDMAVFATFVEDSGLAERDPDGQAWVAQAQASGWLERSVLQCLTPEQVREMLNGVLADLGQHDMLATLVVERSHGRPLLVEGLIRYLIDLGRVQLKGGRLDVHVPEPHELPTDLEQRLLPRLPDLDPEIQRVLAKASVVGHEFHVDVLARLSGLSEAELHDVLQRAHKAALVDIHSEEDDGLYSFHEESFRRSLYDDLSQEDRKELHTATAHVLEQISSGNRDSNLSTLAYHWEAAGDRRRSDEYLTRLTDTYAGLVTPSVVEAYVGRLPQKKDWGVETVLTRQQTTAALRAARLARLCLQNLAGYQSGSELVRSALEALERQLQVVLQHTAVLSFSDGEGRLMVNGEVAPEEESLAAGGPQLLGLLNAGGLKGISFRRGVTGLELREFLELVNMRPAERDARGGWDVLLKGRSVENIMTNERVYLAVGEKDMEVVRRAASVRLVDDGRASAPEELPETLGQALQDLLLRLGNQEEDASGLKASVDTLLERLSKLETSRVEKPAPEPVKENAPVTASGERSASSLVDQLRAKADIYVLQRARQDVDVLIMDLDSLDESVVEATATALVGKGQAAVQPLYTRLRHAQSLRTRKTIVHLLRKLDPLVVNRLLDQLAVGMSGPEARNIVEVLHDVLNLDLGDRVASWIRHPDPDTRAALMSLLVERPSKRGMQILLEALDTAQDDVLVEVIQAIGQVRWRAATSRLAALLKKRTIFIAPDKRIEAQKAACQALGRIEDAASLPVLLEAMASNAFYTFKRAFHFEVRAAAALALPAFPTAAVRTALDAARRDKSDMVRAAARMALARIEGDVPSIQAEPLFGAAVVGREERSDGSSGHYADGGGTGSSDSPGVRHTPRR